MEELPTTVIDLLSNAIVLRQTAPYIPVASLLALSATCRTFRVIITTQKDIWRYLNLTKTATIDTSPIDVGGVTWRAERMDESLTEDDFYAGPLRGICSRLHQRSILQYVQTLVLDGMAVPADLVREIVTEDRYHVRVLSIREAKHLNVSILQQVLRYIVRPTRAASTPKLKALYFFGPKDAARYMIGQQQRLEGSQALGVMASEGAQIGAEWNHRSSDTLSTSLGDEETKWYKPTGRALRKPQSDWPDTLVACLGLIAFDAVLCRGPRHDITKVQSRDFLQPTIATVALGSAGCEAPYQRMPPMSEQRSILTAAAVTAVCRSSSFAAKTVYVAAGVSAVIGGGARTATRNPYRAYIFGLNCNRLRRGRTCKGTDGRGQLRGKR
ncbi:hypothetical protein LTR35_002927 [Friedmanniomyces endolithicus]|uniref:F-box domain-containing protein n=1 Tax=Friedmanniomyces endolithicus TaxID=329885 RepID=A0AAN6G1T0_9PEZI|nr:hypothetical protein LTS00_012426 [Friedmanniomyces endolithicus]KAK0289729.1 hypothetical protein LTR35_002927 [Friedmanniomyces endolithicus]KAK0328495.1 hypothetical protein LTR82_000426 [Friedmanniomyces endolithicus]KAK1019808.1 hypothetical protein LTR54_000451 [Friedmanniomyces endolithicus]